MNIDQEFDFSIVRNLRRKRGLTAEALACQANITRATIVKLESGKGNPTIETLNAVGKVFQLSASQLVQMAETGKPEAGRTTPYDQEGFKGIQVCFQNLEIFSLEAAAGSRAVSSPDLHNHTAEICMVISGRLRVRVRAETQTLAPGQAIRFKAIHDHELQALEDTRLLLIHHLLT